MHTRSILCITLQEIQFYQFPVLYPDKLQPVLIAWLVCPKGLLLANSWPAYSEDTYEQSHEELKNN